MRTQVRGIVGRALAVVLDVDPASVHDGLRIREDLHADSLALIELADVVEEQVSGRLHRAVHIGDPDLDAFVTVGDAVDYLVCRL